MIIRDNLLTPKGFDDLKEQVIYNKQLPWFWRNSKVRESDLIQSLVHPVYANMKPVSDYFNLIHTYFSVPLDITTWYRIKINCTWKSSEQTVFGWHTDFTDNEEPRKFKAMKTALFYCSDTNGPTAFEKSEERVECISNRLLCFDSLLDHSGISHTEGDERRIVINFNYF